MDGSASPETLADLVSFLLGCPAFHGVAPARVERLVREAEVAYLVEGGDVPVAVASAPFVLQRGAILVRDAAGRTTDLVAPGEFHAPIADQQLEPVADTLLVLLPDTSIDVAWSRSYREMTAAVRGRGGGDGDPQMAPVASVMTPGVITVGADESCRAAAERMREHKISSLIVDDGDQRGIVTDRDLRNRLVAGGGSVDDPVRRIATFPVQTVDDDTPVMEVLVEMLASGIHHVPVTDGRDIVGMVTSSDLLQLRLRSPLYLRKALDRSTSVDELAAAMTTLPDTAGALLHAGVAALSVTRVIATVTDRLVRRLLTFAEQELGLPPVAYAWLAFGSQARGEQTLRTDQDTGLMFADDADDDARRWFAALGRWVTDGLARCGLPRCDGGVMASEDDYRRDVSGWRSRLRHFIAEPDSAGLIGAEITFDLRGVAGELDVEELLGPTVATAADERLFLGHLAREAVRHRPPLGFWGAFAVERSGEHSGTFDIKRGAMLPIADIARLHALARGGRELATADRLSGAVEAGQMSRDLHDILSAGYELATRVRLERHFQQIGDGVPTDNQVRPDDLPPLVRSQLKATFKAIRTAQDAVASLYHTSRLG